VPSSPRFAMTEIDSAFRATTYRVFVPNAAPIDIRIGQRSAPLDALLDARGCREWAFITAWNPGAKALSAAENDARQLQLLSELRQRGWDWLDGSGIPADASWKAEASVLVLGISADDAVVLGRHFGQLAVVTGARGSASELVYCSAGASPAS
jgi:hypothetical protein